MTQVYGMDSPQTLEEGTGLTFIREHEMTPEALVSQLKGMEGKVFRKLYAGTIAKKLYRLYEYKKEA